MIQNSFFVELTGLIEKPDLVSLIYNLTPNMEC